MKLGSLIAGAAMAVAGCMAQAHAADVTLRLGHVGAPISPQQTIGDMLAKKVETYSNGSVKIKIFNSGTLGNERQLQEAVRSGTLDMTIAGTFSNFVPWAGALEAPLLYSSLDDFVTFYASDQGHELMKDFEKDAGVKTLFVAPHGGFRYITMKDKEIRKPSDLEGVKIRNPNVPSFNIVAKAFGAIPVPIDFSELYVALQRGVVQGQHNPVGNIVGAKLYEVQTSLSEVPWGISPHFVSMSKAAWARLDSSQKAAMEKAAAETAKAYPQVAKQEEKKLLDEIKDKIKIIPPEDIDLAAFAKVFRDKGLPELEKAYGPKATKWLKDINASR